jgi:hypothetical protein
MIIAVLLFALVGIIQQDPPKENKPSKRGDVVVAKGCVKGGVLETSELSAAGDDGTGVSESITFRLTGEKELLQQLKKEHDGHADTITGELKTDLPTNRETRGKKIGNTGITVGVGGSRGMLQAPPPPMPVLKVTSFEHTGVTCR